MHALATVAGLAGLAAAVPQNWNNWNQAPARGPRKEFDKSWCGVVTLVDNLSAIEASWTTPTASFPSQADATLHYSAYQWVGIGGDTNVCHGKQDLAQAGTGVEVRVPCPSLCFSFYDCWLVLTKSSVCRSRMVLPTTTLTMRCSPARVPWSATTWSVSIPRSPMSSTPPLPRR